VPLKELIQVVNFLDFVTILAIIDTGDGDLPGSARQLYDFIMFDARGGARIALNADRHTTTLLEPWEARLVYTRPD
jgi:hypothetical protein